MSLQEKIYSYLTGEPFWAINRTPNVQTQLYLKDTIGLYYADKALLIYSLFWLGQVFLQYHHHYLWLPHSEFTVQSPLAAWLLAYLLKPIVWYVLFGVVVCANALVFRFSNSIILRLTWALGIILLNMPAENYGYHGHGSRFFYVVLLLHIFIFPTKNSSDADLKMQSRSRSVLFFGLLFTYFLAGFWKIYPTVLYHPWNQYYGDGLITWISPDALWLESLSNLLSRDLDTNPAAFLYQWRYGLNVLVILTILTQFVSPIAAFRRFLLWWIIPTLLIFHLLSGLFFGIHFGNQWLLLILFFPYQSFFDKATVRSLTLSTTQFTGKKQKAIYTKCYVPHGEARYRSIYAYRQYWLDRKKSYSILLYIPGVCTLVHLFWQIQKSSAHSTSRQK